MKKILIGIFLLVKLYYVDCADQMNPQQELYEALSEDDPIKVKRALERGADPMKPEAIELADGWNYINMIRLINNQEIFNLFFENKKFNVKQVFEEMSPLDWRMFFAPNGVKNFKKNKKLIFKYFVPIKLKLCAPYMSNITAPRAVSCPDAEAYLNCFTYAWNIEDNKIEWYQQYLDMFARSGMSEQQAQELLTPKITFLGSTQGLIPENIKSERQALIARYIKAGKFKKSSPTYFDEAIVRIIE